MHFYLQDCSEEVVVVDCSATRVPQLGLVVWVRLVHPEVSSAHLPQLLWEAFNRPNQSAEIRI